MSKQKLPEWFNGITYDEGNKVINPETNEELKLDNLELSMYDFVMGSEMLIGDKSPDLYIQYREEGLEWLKQSNPEIINFIENSI